MLEEELTRGRLPVELTALMSWAGEGNVRFAVICHQATEEGRQQCLPVFQQAGDDLLGIEGRRLLSEVNIAVDLARGCKGARSAMRCESASAHKGV